MESIADACPSEKSEHEEEIEQNSDAANLIVKDVKFKNIHFRKNVVAQKKRKKLDAAELESKRLAQGEYDREIHEQRYKRLIHLLNRSQFYSSYIINKIDNTPNAISIKSKKRGRNWGKVESTDENTPPVENEVKTQKLSGNYNIREYISADVKKKKLHVAKDKMNFNNEDIETELHADAEGAPTMNNDISIEMPTYFNGELHNYQKEGFNWLKILYENGLNGILGDEMGLGKTVQVITLLCHLIEKKQNGPYLIIVPLSTIPNWILEFERFAPKLPVVVFYGKPDVRARTQEEIVRKHLVGDGYRTQPIVLTSFEVPLVEKAFMRTQNWRYIIIDEGQRIKNHQCQLLKFLKLCKSMNRLLLTGTPLQNNLSELWSLLNFLLPEIFNDLAIFESWFDVKDLQYDESAKKFLQQEEEKHVVSSLREILKPFMLRRGKADVSLDIPPKKEVIVYAPLTELQHDLYTAVLNQDLATLYKIDQQSLVIVTENNERPRRKCLLRHPYNLDKYKKNTGDKETPTRSSNLENDDSMDTDTGEKLGKHEKKDLSMWQNYVDVTERNRDFLIKLTFGNRVPMYKKIVDHPYLVHYPLDPTGMPRVDEDLVKASGKLLVLDIMLAKLKSRGHKVLLFSTMTLMLDMIEDYLSMRNYRYLRLDGQSPLEERKENIKLFNSDPNIFLFIISTRAGGVGLNLAAADTVIMYDSDWNPQMDIQAMARCHRIGQTRPVMIYRFCTKYTIDERIIHRAEAKRVLEKMVISKKASNAFTHNKDHLMELKELIQSKDLQVFTSKNEVFTEEELNKLLDRSDMMPATGRTS